MQKRNIKEVAEFQKFVLFMKAQRNAKDRTIQNYLRVLNSFLSWSRLRKMDLHDWTSEMAYEFIGTFKNRSTRFAYATAIKNFFVLLNYPAAESFKVPPKPKRKLPEVLTEKQILKMAQTCDNIRDKALILVTYESSRRNMEILSLKIKHVKFDDYGAEVLFKSTKSEDANIRLVMSASSLQGWLEVHKWRDDLDAFVFYAQGRQMNPERFRQIVKKAAFQAGLKRRVYPHLLRHSRIAVLKRENRLTVADILNISGHTETKMLDIYGRVTNTQTNEKLLEIAGLKQLPEEDQPVKAKKCYRCGFLNDPLVKLCKRCGLPLTVEEALRVDDDLKWIRENKELLLEGIRKLKELER